MSVMAKLLQNTFIKLSYYNDYLVLDLKRNIFGKLIINLTHIGITKYLRYETNYLEI